MTAPGANYRTRPEVPHDADAPSEAARACPKYLAAASSQGRKYKMSKFSEREQGRETSSKRARDKQTAAGDKVRPLRRSPLSRGQQTQAPPANHQRRTRRPAGSINDWLSFVALRRAWAPFLFVLMMMLAAAGGASSGPRRPANLAAGGEFKLELWRSLVRSLYAPPGAALDEPASGIKSSQLELLAERLARWPDQRRAALFFIDQLARRLESPPDGFKFCRQLSWAQLSEPATGAGHSTARSLERRVALDRLADNRKLLEHLNEQAASAPAARLALDSANLISRLLLTEVAREPGGSAVGAPTDEESAGFFGSFLAAFKSSRAAVGRKSGSGRNSAASRTRLDGEADELLKDTRNLELLLNRLVTPKFLRYLLAMKLREHSALAPAPPAGQLVHSVGALMLEDPAQEGARSSNVRETGPEEEMAARVRVSFATLAQLQQPSASPTGREPSIQFTDLLASSEGGFEAGRGRPLSELPFERPPSFIARWILADRLGELDKLKMRLAAGAQLQKEPEHHQLQLADGEWFSPQFECALAARWLLTYSAPIFAAANNGSIQFRGVSFVSLDLARSGPLINQCATGSISLLANTNQCRARLAGSQCVPLASHLQLGAQRQVQFRPGAYACQCPASWPHLGPAGRAASLQRSKELIELLRRRGGARPSAGRRDQSDEADLSFIGFPAAAEQQAGPLHDKRWAAQVLAANWRRNSTSAASRPGRREQQQQHSYFALGAQLESEAALEWLADEREGPPPAARQLCELCKEIGEPDESPGGALECESSSAIESGAGREDDFLPGAPVADVERRSLSWLRPLVLVVQSGCLVITLGLICVILRIRKSRLIIVSGWLMLETMLIGAVLLHTSILVRYFQPTSLTCLLEPWLRELGFSIFYGSILIKLYRILTEFQTRKAHRVCLRDKDQIVYLLAIVFIVIGYMSAWTALMVDGFFVSSEPQAAFDIATGGEPLAVPSAAGPDVLSRVSRQASGRQHSRHHSGFVGADLDRFDEAKEPALDLMRLNLSPPDGAQSRLALVSTETSSSRSEQLAKLPTIPLNHLATRANLNAKLPPATMGPGAVNSTRPARSATTSFSSASLEAPADRATDASNPHEPRQQKQQQQQQQPLESRQSRWPVRANKRASDEDGSGAATSLAGEHLEILARGLNSFGELFLGLLESEQHYEPESDTLVYLIRCRKLTWDYVTESSEIALLLFGVHLVYKLRNASLEVHKEKLILSAAIFIELLISSSLYLVRHTLWHRLTGDHLLILYSIRCQLTVTLTVALVFGPQLWQIGKSKPSLLLSALFNYSFHAYNDHSAPAAGTAAGSMSGAGVAGASGGAPARGKHANSTRHRCHISCELHDHHLGDASRLQQAMLSNSALEIGSINLADMDPDEIQAELKRVYTQLELLKTKMMRRDNPHISKRRGGRKPGHRKFSLQAFHNRHSGAGEHHPAPTNAPTNEPAGIGTSEQVGLLAAARQAQQQNLAPTSQYPRSSSGARLPALAEHEGESLLAQANQHVSKSLLGKRVSGCAPNSSGKHVRVDDNVREFDDHRPSQQAERSLSMNTNGRFKPASLTSKLMGRAKSKKQQQQNPRNGSKAKWTPELPSTSSLGLDDETMMALNDSQSSGELTPQHRSSIAFSSSCHNEEHSVN